MVNCGCDQVSSTDFDFSRSTSASPTAGLLTVNSVGVRSSGFESRSESHDVKATMVATIIIAYENIFFISVCFIIKFASGEQQAENHVLSRLLPVTI